MNPEVNLHASTTAVNQEQTPAQREWVKPAAKVADVSVATMNGSNATFDGVACHS